MTKECSEQLSSNLLLRSLMLTVVPKVDSVSIGISLLVILIEKISTDSTILSVRTEMLLAVHLLSSPAENVMTSFKAVKSTPIILHSKMYDEKVVFIHEAFSVIL